MVLRGLRLALLLATALNTGHVNAEAPSTGSKVEGPGKVDTVNQENPALPSKGPTTEKGPVQTGVRSADVAREKGSVQTGVSSADGTTVKSDLKLETGPTPPPAAKEKSSCLEPISVKVLRAEEGGISALDSALSSQIDVLNITGVRVYSVDYHYTKRLLFFAAHDSIYRNEVAGRLIPSRFTLPVVKVGVDGPLSLAVDWVHDRLYWLSTRHRTLEAADLDGGNRSTIIDTLTHLEYPNNIVLDPYDEYLFLVNNHTIYRSNLKGKELVRIDLENSGSGYIKNLAVDIYRKRLFFTGRAGNVKTGAPYIASCDYFGKQVKQHPLASKWNDIYSIDVFQDTLYFAHFKSGYMDALWTADLNAPSVSPVFKYSVPTANSGILSVRVYHPGKQDLTANSCKEEGN